MKALLYAAALAAAGPATAQTMDHSTMPGMKMPAKPAARANPVAKRQPVATKPGAKKAPARKAARRAARPADPHAGHDMSAMPSPEMTSGTKLTPGTEVAPDKPMQHDMASMPGVAATLNGTDLEPGNAPAPAPVPGLAASRYYGEAAMREADRDLRREHGGMTYHQVLFNLAEYQARKGGDGYRWDGTAWIGGDIDRLALKSEGEGTLGAPIEQAEVQALYSRALDPYWNLQAGVRYDFKPNPSRTYATVGIEGLAPYWFDIEGAVFLSGKGDVLGRAEAWYDERVTQFFVLQPRVEANFSAQEVRRDKIGSGLTDLELGLRLRYEKSREVAPYIGLSWERQFGGTARFTRARGGDTGGFSFVAGVRTWF